MIDTILELLSYIDAPEMKKFILILLLYLLAVIGAGKLFHSYLVIKYIRNSFIAVLGAVIVITADILFIEPSTGEHLGIFMGSRCSLPAFSFYFIHKIQALLPYSQSDEKNRIRGYYFCMEEIK